MPGSQLAGLRFFHIIAKLIFNMFHRRAEIAANRASPASRNIFGDMDENEDLEYPLTPSFEPVSERSILSSEDYDVQSSRYASCCLESYEDSSVAPTRGIS